MKKDIEKTIIIPENINILIGKNEIIIKKGSYEIKRKFKIKDIKILNKNSSLVIMKNKANKNDKKKINSLIKHIQNALRGFEKKYEYKLQICSVHFPMTVKIEKDRFIIKNFLGERKERTIKLNPNVEVRVDNDIIYVASADKELAGQTASKIEQLTKIKARDRRVFQDGIWIIKKEKGRGQIK